jgi:hypothetical protein
MTAGFGSVFYELAALFALAATIGIIGLLLRQPLIVAFIATGIIAGGDVLGIVRSTEHVDVLAQIGIGLLLFLVGLKLDLQIIRNLGPVAVATGLGQVIFTSVVGFAICMALGFDCVDQHLYRRRAHLFEHHHHRQASVRQRRTRLAARPHRARFFDRSGHRRRGRNGCVVVARRRRQCESRRFRCARRAAERPSDGCLCRRVHSLRRRAAVAPDFARAGIARHFCYRLGGAVRGGRRLARLRQGTRRTARRRLARVDFRPRSDRVASLEPARFSAAVLSSSVSDRASISACSASRCRPPFCFPLSC